MSIVALPTLVNEAWSNDEDRGPDRIAIYNESFAPLAVNAHPKLMGSPFRVAFAEIWDAIRPVFDLAEATRKAVDVNKIELFVERSGYTEETYFTGNFNPVRGSDGKVAGFINACHEVTDQMLHDRRTAMINLLAAAPARLDSLSIGDHVMEIFKTNDRDVPMAMLYQVDEETTPGTCMLNLRGMLGVPTGHSIAVDHIDILDPAGLIPLLRAARTEIFSTTQVDERFDGINWLGFGEPAKFVSSVALASGGTLLGFLVIGHNPRRDLDDPTKQFVRDLARQVSAILASMMTAEQARKREIRLQEDLEDSERKIRYLADHASVGMQQVHVCLAPSPSILGSCPWACLTSDGDPGEWYNALGQ